MDSNKELWQLFQSAKKGNDEAYEQLCNDTYDVVYNLVAMIYEKEENRNKLVKHIFTKMRKAIASENIDDKDVLRWVAQYATTVTYKVYVSQKGELFTESEDDREYDYNSIDGDNDFYDCCVYFNEAIEENFEEIAGTMDKLSKPQKIIYQLFCYEECSIDEIEDILETDSLYVCSEIAALREIIIDDYNEKFADNENADSEEDGSQIDIVEDEDDVIDKIYTIVPEKIMIGIGVGIAVVVVAIIVVVASMAGKSGKGGSTDTTTKASVTKEQTIKDSQNATSKPAQDWKNELTTPAGIEDSPTRKPAGGSGGQSTTTTQAPSTQAPEQETTTEAETPEPKPTETQEPGPKPTETQEPESKPTETQKPEPTQTETQSEQVQQAQ